MTQPSLLCRSLRPPTTPRFLLLGPPELLRQSATNPPQPSPPPPPPPPPPSNPFMDNMVAHFNNVKTMGFTENHSPTFLTTGNPCLDFFFHVVPGTPADSLTTRLGLAWARDPLTTLKLVCNLRGVRGTGKSDREGFYTAALWLHRHHPKTLASNLPSFASFGYFKDLPEILYRLLEGPDVRQLQRDEWEKKKVMALCRRGKVSRNNMKKDKVTGKGGGGLAAAMARSQEEKKRARVLRKEKLHAMGNKVLDRYETDHEFCNLHDKVADHFAECLLADVDLIKEKDDEDAKRVVISLAAKWCPSLDSMFDKSTLLCESIAKRVFPRECYSEYEGIEESHYAYRVRDRLRKEVLVPLRKALELPEVYMSANLWSSIPYNRVASLAMRNYQDKFLKHDEARFTQYLSDVKAGKAKITAGALLPHEIICTVRGNNGYGYCKYSSDDDNDKSGDNDDVDVQVAELQWKRMVDDLVKEGKMRNCLAVCDVSGSMSGTPMDVSVALGLLVSELSDEPWKGKVVTFSQNPQLHLIKGDNLRSKIAFVERMEWDMNTDFQKVFDMILRVAVSGGLREEDMIKRVFVFSDMEFDMASASDWETDYKAIVRKFTASGYGGAVPQIVFWNLRESTSTPVGGDQEGVALLSGFSKNLMKLFLDDDGDVRFTPETTMMLALSGEEYQKLVVVD